MSKKIKTPIEEKRGGKRPGAGRKKGATKATGYKVDKKKNPPPVEPPPPPPPPEEPPSQSSAGSHTSLPPSPEEPPSPPPGEPSSPPPPPDDEPVIDFSRYKRSGEDKAPPLEDSQPAGAKPPPIVVINGKMLLAFLNFLTPAVFTWVANFASGGFEKADFALDEEDTKVLEPAADQIAAELFKNMPPMVQLLFGYGIISFSSARKKKRIREKQAKPNMTIHINAETA